MNNSMNDKIASRTRGVSMIEILLVVVIICVISVISLRIMVESTDEAKLKVAASEVRHWLDAGLTFETHQGRWPRNTSELHQVYPGTLRIKNPWGLGFSTLQNTDNKTTFSIKTELPNSRLAKRLATRLGVAEVSGTEVIASIGSKTLPVESDRIVVKKIGTIDTTGNWHKTVGDQEGGDSYRLKDSDVIDHDTLRDNARRILIPVPHCPKGMQPGHKVSLAGFSKGCHQAKGLFDTQWTCSNSVNAITYSQTTFTRDVKPYQKTNTIVDTKDGKAWEYWVRATGKSNKGLGTLDPLEIFISFRDLPSYHGGLTYITYCEGVPTA